MTTADTGFLSNTARDVITVVGLVLTVFQAFMAVAALRLSGNNLHHIKADISSFRERISVIKPFIQWFCISELAHAILNILLRSHLITSIKSFDDPTNVLTWIFTFADGLTFMVLFLEAPDALMRNEQHDQNQAEEERLFIKWGFRVGFMCTLPATLGVLVSKGLFEETTWAYKAFLIQLIGPWFVIAFFAAILNVASFVFLLQYAWHRVKGAAPEN